MLRLLAGFDQFSFWIGFLAASLFWWLYARIAPTLRVKLREARERAAARRDALRVGVEYDYRNDFIRFIQGRHLAADLFSLDEILVQPKILAPPPIVEPGEDPSETGILARLVPYLPDYPEFASAYGAERLALAEALLAGANLAIVGHGGSGKTVALAHIGTQIASLSPNAGELADLVPFYLHAADLALPLPEEVTPIQAVVTGISSGGYLSRRTIQRFPIFVETVFREARAIVLLDGLDELAPEGVRQAAAFMKSLFAQYPNLRTVAAVSPEYYDGITALGLTPVAMAGWTKAERSRFVEQWGRRWQASIEPHLWGRPEAGVENVLLLNWLRNEAAVLTPLEMTLRTWAVFAGDGLGAANHHGLAAYIRRKTIDLSNADLALERIATQMLIAMRPVIPARAAALWSRGEYLEAPGSGEDEGGQDPAAQGRVGGSIVDDLVDSGLLAAHPDGTVRFGHPAVAGYFAGRGLGSSGRAAEVAGQLNWELRHLSLQSLAAHSDVTDLLPDPTPGDLLNESTFAGARWLRNMEPKSNARLALMRRLAALFQNEGEPGWTRARAIAALALSADPGVGPLGKKLLDSPDPFIRSLSALALGYLRDVKYETELTQALEDRNFLVRASACFGLALLGTQSAVESVATVLLSGDEDGQQAAAEALALVSGEGHSLLFEAAEVDDLMVRRAAIFGLAKTGHPEAGQTIRKLQLEDDQWIVRNVANQEMVRMEGGSVSVPRPLEPLHLVPWLIAYAGEVGEGITKGKSASDMLYRALLQGDIEQRLAAMARYRIAGSEEAASALEDMMQDTDPELKTAAAQTLWHLHAQGIGQA